MRLLSLSLFFLLIYRLTIFALNSLQGYVATIGPYANAIGIDSDDINHLFGNLKEVYQFNR